MKLITLSHIDLAYGYIPLLKDANLAIENGQKIGIIGRNGAGKSSLLKLLNQEIEPDAGEMMFKPGVRVSKLIQEIPKDINHTVYQEVLTGHGELGRLLLRYHDVLQRPEALDELSEIQQQITEQSGWDLERQAEKVLSKMQLPADEQVSKLSGGMVRRVLLAKSLVSEPDILLLDEPTNHLDIATIEWLEQFLIDYKKTLVIITHDRCLLRKITSDIVELDRGQLTRWDCGYEKFLERKAEFLATEAKENALFDKRLAEEEKWIRKGIQARRTRNEGRVRRLKQMRVERQQRLSVQGKVALKQHEVAASGKKVFELEAVNFAYDNKSIVKDFSALVMRGDKIGLIGANGSGKSTLVKLLLGNIQPTSGVINQGTKLNIRYFDQYRQQLDEEKTVVENVSDGTDFVQIGGKSQHIMGYLADFLFTAERARTPVSALSGGERHRLLLARMFSQPANVLILDEPTNDLDAETLELLEERLIDYQGTLILVSHDREFINNVVTSTWSFDGNGHISEYIGGYDDYLRQRPALAEPVVKSKTADSSKQEQAKKRLQYNEQKELKKIPEKIEKLEAKIAAIHEQMSEANFYQQSEEQQAMIQQKLLDLEHAVAELYKRWEVLEF